MDGFDPLTSFGPEAAARYDREEVRGDEVETVALLHELAVGGPALELAIGTGRIAVPLAASGTRVHGIEQSAAMVEQLRAKPGGDAITVVLGDMTTADATGRFPLVYLVFNTIFNVLTQDGQVRCFENAGRHLTDDGVFLVEAAVPSAWIVGGRSVEAERVTADAVTLDVHHYDPVTQVFDENHVTLSATGIRFGPISCRLAPPAELDLMARIAGLALRERWGGWHREPFTADSVRHVSVYGRA